MTKNSLSGTCGTCRWEFARCSINYQDTFAFYIAPIDPEHGGVLGEWKDVDETGDMVPPWYDHPAVECGDTIRVSVLPGVKATTCRSAFAGFCMAHEIDLSGLDTSNVTDMSHMFASCSSLRSLDMSMLDTSQVTDMHGMFSDCESLTTLDMAVFDALNAINLLHMVSDCGVSNDVAWWQALSKVKDMSSMLNASQVINMSDMFSECVSLNSVGINLVRPVRP